MCDGEWSVMEKGVMETDNGGGVVKAMMETDNRDGCGRERNDRGLCVMKRRL